MLHLRGHVRSCFLWLNLSKHTPPGRSEMHCRKWCFQLPISCHRCHHSYREGSRHRQNKGNSRQIWNKAKSVGFKHFVTWNCVSKKYIKLTWYIAGKCSGGLWFWLCCLRYQLEKWCAFPTLSPTITNNYFFVKYYNIFYAYKTYIIRATFFKSAKILLNLIIFNTKPLT